MTFDQKTIVVSGAAKGIGAATARMFREKGARLVLLDVTSEAESDVAVDPYANLYIECDVSKSDQVESAFRQAIDRFGGVDVLVNNAGIQAYGSVTETTDDDWDRVLGVNLRGAFLCARQALRAMTEQRNGVIVNVSSVQGFMSESRAAAYVTSKTALLGLTRSIAVDYAPEIRCVAVCPGTVDTPMLHWAANESGDPEAMLENVRSMHLVDRIARPEEIARLITYLASDDAAFITGQAFRIDGGLGVRVGG